MNLDQYGNTSAAAVAIALDEANRTGRIKTRRLRLDGRFRWRTTWAKHESSNGKITRRLTAILIADVVGYSRLMGTDEAGTLAAVKSDAD